jgi:uncharacterized protein (DUF3820 family)
MAFDNIEQPKVQVVNPNEYVLGFGKYKGEKLIDVFNKDRSYCIWLKENSYQREVPELIKQIEASQEDEI